MENLSVGQVVFVFVPEDHGILPVQVVEEVVHRKLAGVETRYFVRASPEPDAKVFQLNAKKHSVFPTLASAREFMIENATRAIDEICREAEAIHDKFRPARKFDSPPPEPSPTISALAPSPAVGTAQVRLPTGEMVNVIL